MIIHACHVCHLDSDEKERGVQSMKQDVGASLEF